MTAGLRKLHGGGAIRDIIFRGQRHFDPNIITSQKGERTRYEAKGKIRTQKREHQDKDHGSRHGCRIAFGTAV